MTLRRSLAALLALLLCSSVLAFVLLVAPARKSKGGYFSEVGGLCQPSTMLCSTCMVYYRPAGILGVPPANCMAVSCGAGALPPTFCACQYTGSGANVCFQFTGPAIPIPAPGCGNGTAKLYNPAPGGNCDFNTLGGCAGGGFFSCGTGTIQGCGGNGSGC